VVLRLAPDPTLEGDTGVLWCDDIDARTTTGCPRVVLLAACSSGQGAYRPGDDGLGHLGGAFLGRGAQAVVLARHDVELAATLRLLEVLNARMAAGDTIQEATRRAREALLEHPRTAHPFHWGAFALVGLGQRAPLAAR
jgi:CHAT domain-containing protein